MSEQNPQDSGPRTQDLRIDILTLFPEMFPGCAGRQASWGEASEQRHRLVSRPRHSRRMPRTSTRRSTIDRLVEGREWSSCASRCHDAVLGGGGDGSPSGDTRILLTPQGERLEQARVEQLATNPTGRRLLLIAGHYEGVDERVIDELRPQWSFRSGTMSSPEARFRRWR